MTTFKMPVMCGPFATDQVVESKVAYWQTERDLARNTIPPITVPLGRYWDQPDRSSITVRGGTAYMTKSDFQKLSEYSTSIPSGVYEGKMWRRVQRDGNYLCWYAPHEDPKRMKIESRRIAIW